MRALRFHPHAESILGETEEILRLADLVKFAKVQPGITEHEKLLSVAYDIVDRTKQVVTPAPLVENQTEPADVDR